MPGSVVLTRQLPQSPNTTQLLTGETFKLQSGKWVGFFKDPRFQGDEQIWPMDIFLVMKNKKEVWGFGRDDVDVFTVESGSISGQQINFNKVYTSHVIYYAGHINQHGTHINGIWSFHTTANGGGTFSLWREPV